MASGKNLIEFEEIEKISLLLDILVDCEEYDDFDATLIRVENVDITCIKNPTEENINKKIEYFRNKNPEKVNDYFEIILNSKYIRRVLRQNKENVQRKGVDLLFQKLGEALIKTIPTRPIKQEENEDKKEENGAEINRVRIIFLNEISAVSQGHLAIGYAEMALSELRKLDENWQQKENRGTRIKHPYELYALYNKGLTLVHDPEPMTTEQAIDTFSQILKTFEKSESSDLRKTFEKEEYKKCSNISELFDIFFWLIYVPTNHLLADAYDELNSSYDLEKTISNTLKKIDKQDISLENYKISTEKIKKYHKAKFTIQLILAKIYSGDFAKDFESCELNKNWLKAFEKSSSSFKYSIEFNLLREYSKTKNELDAAEALFWLEYAKTCKKDKRRKNEFALRSFDKCQENLDEKKLVDADWSDFAVTFLDSIIFILENHVNESGDWINDSIGKSRNKNNRIVYFNKIYEEIFQKIKDEDWIPRKKHLVEKFLKCQEKLLQKDEQKEEKGDCGNYLKYQFELVKVIWEEDGPRKFKKSWPESEKEKLTKNLYRLIKLFENEKKYKFEEIFEDKKSFTNHFEKDIKPRIKSDDESNDNRIDMPPKEELRKVANFIKDKMNCDFYTRKLRLNSETFYDHLIYQSRRPSLEDHYVLTVLRRWQSFTPALSSGSEVGQKGGGYFVYKTNGKGEIEEGLVVDPGFNFLENFFGEGFSIRDINAILMTHSHPDHSSDFMSIMTLVHEMNKCGERVFADGKWEKRKLVLFMTEGCHQNFAEQINRKTDTFKDIIRVKQDEKSYGKDVFLERFTLKVTKANHKDLTNCDSVGYVILDENGEKLVGFTGDTQWYCGIEKKYKDCPVICMNIGGVVDVFKEGNITLSDLIQNKDKKAYNNIKKILLRENHLYLPGFYLMAKKFNKKQKLLIISELCEEMKGGLRTDLAKKISGDIKIPILPEDIGLTVVLNNNKKNKKTGNVFCKICQSEHPPEEIVAVETDKDNAIIYLCHYHYNKLKEGSSLPKINELKLDANELHNPLIKEDSAGLSPCLKKIIGK